MQVLDQARGGSSSRAARSRPAHGPCRTGSNQRLRVGWISSIVPALSATPRRPFVANRLAAMVLSDRTIRAEIDSGRIAFDPYDPD